MCPLVMYLGQVTCFVSVYLMVAFSIERYIAVHYPFARARICTIAKAKKITFAVTIGAMLIFSYAWVIAQVVEKQPNKKNDDTTAYTQPLEALDPEMINSTKNESLEHNYRDLITHIMDLNEAGSKKNLPLGIDNLVPIDKFDSGGTFELENSTMETPAEENLTKRSKILDGNSFSYVVSMGPGNESLWFPNTKGKVNIIRLCIYFGFFLILSVKLKILICKNRLNPCHTSPQ